MNSVQRKRVLLIFFVDVAICHLIPLIVHRREDIAEVTVDTSSKRIAFTRPFLPVAEKTSAAVIAHYFKKGTLYVHDWSGSSTIEKRKDEVQVVTIKRVQGFVSYISRSRISALDETVTSLAVDWITDKLYFAIEIPVTHTNVGRIEVCTLGTQRLCTLVISSTADVSTPKVESLHFLVLDPVAGWMYWLNSLNKWVEGAWMDGRNHLVNMFNQSFGDNVVTTGLTLDQETHSLYYLRIDSSSHETGLWNCRLTKPYSCNFVTSLGSGHYLGVSENYVLWTSLLPQVSSSSLTICEKKFCSNGSFIKVANSEGFGAFLVNDSSCQPPRLFPNPCSSNNGGCSHFCTLIPESPWRSCLCPVGMKLYEDERTCADRIRKVLFVATSSGMLYISLDTSHHIPMPISLLEHIDITYIDYDPVDKRLFFIERDSKNIMACGVDGSDLQVLVNNLKSEPNFIAFDWLNRNIYWLDAKGGRIKVQSFVSKVSRVIYGNGEHILRSLAIEPDRGYIYFADNPIKTNQFRIVKAWLDGSNQQTLVSLDYEPSGIAVDGPTNTIYWSDNERVLLRSAFLNNGTFKNTFNKSDDRPASMSKLGNFLYYITLFGRQIYMLNLTQNGAEPSGEKIDFMNGMMIYSLQNIRAVDLSYVPKGHSLCSINNGGCNHICVKLPSGRKRCLCREGFELAADDVTCYLPDAFLVYKQSTNPYAVMRASLNPKSSSRSRIHFEGDENAYGSISLDYGRQRFLWLFEEPEGRFSTIYGAYYNGTNVESILVGEAIGDVAVDWITGNVYWCNIAHRRIEVSRQDGFSRRSILWKNLVPRCLVLHPRFQFIAFINTLDRNSTIHISPLYGNISGEVGQPLYTSSGIINSLLIDYDNDRFVWYSMNGSVGQLFSMNFDGLNLKNWVASNTFAPVSLSVYKGRIYFANSGSTAIEIFENGKFSVLHRDIPKISWLSIAYHNKFLDRNGCSFANGGCPKLCIPHGRKAECFCDDHETFDGRSRKCIASKHFVLLGSENHIIRINLLVENDKKMIDEPYAVLHMDNVGLPKSVDFDIFSSSRFVYWLDAKEESVLKRASDSYNVSKRMNKAQILNITHGLSCTTLTSLAIDNYGRQLYISCKESCIGQGSSIHVFRIKSDDSLVYVGCVVDGKKVSQISGRKPCPDQITLFPNLNMLFYTDQCATEGKMVRCAMNGQRCISWNATDLANSSRLHAFHNAEDRVFFTTNNGFHWHPAMDYASDHQPHIYVDNVQDVVPISSEKVLMFKEENGYSRLTEYPLVAKHTFLEMSIVVPYVLAVSDVFENDGTMKSSNTCDESPCSHLCIVHRGKAAEDRFECFCPLDHYMRENNCSKTAICDRWQFACENGKHCVHYFSMCDGFPDCEDNSDEHSSICKNVGLRNWPCLNGDNSIPRDHVCDGKKDCFDGSDEAHCRCLNPAAEFDCKNRVTNTFNCIEKGKLCTELQNCTNISDDEKNRCRESKPTSHTRRASLSFEFAVPFLIFLVIFCIAISICCCHFASRRKVSNRYNSHPIHFNGSGAEAHVFLPATPVGTQVEFQLRTFPVGGVSAVYNTVPAFNISLSGSEANSHAGVPSHIYSVASSSMSASLNHHRDFIAPPPSAASLSTYGVVKPAGMKMYVENRPNVGSILKRNRRKARAKRSRNQQKKTPPPPYSQIRKELISDQERRSFCTNPDGHRAPTNTCVIDSSESSTAGETAEDETANSYRSSSSSSSLDNEILRS